MELKRNHTPEISRRVFQIDGLDAVQYQRDVMAFGGDLIIVPLELLRFCAVFLNGLS
jgi:hypothetical protein